MSNSVILKVSKSQKYGRIANVHMDFSELYVARQHADTLNSFALADGDFYVSCKREHVQHVCNNVGAAFIN